MAKKKTKKEESTVTIKVEWIIIGVLFILLLASVFTSGYSNLPFNLNSPLEDKKQEVKGEEVLNEDEIKTRYADYINNELLQGQGGAEVVKVEKDDSANLYKLTIEYNGQEITSFASLDGKYFYSERYEVKTEEEAVADYPKKDTPDALLFTMSYCPYGNQADEFVAPVYDLLGDKINFEPHYVIYSDYASKQGADWQDFCLDSEEKYCSMHGTGELNQNVRELCAWKYDQEKYWDFVLAANNQCNSSNIDKCWGGVAENVGLDVNQIRSCQESEAEELLAEEVRLNEQYNVTGSPDIKINGVDYTGSRTPEAYKKAVCASFNQQPEECSTELDSEGEAASGSCN